MEPIHEEGYPLHGKISTPRQVVQTVGCLLDHATRPLQAQFLQSLKAMLCADGNPSTLYTLFLVVFVPEVVAVEIAIQSAKDIELFRLLDAVCEELAAEKVPRPHEPELKPVLAPGNYVEIGWITPPVTCHNQSM